MTLIPKTLPTENDNVIELVPSKLTDNKSLKKQKLMQIKLLKK